MARKKPTQSSKAETPQPSAAARLRRCVQRWIIRGVVAVVSIILLLASLFALIDPPTTPYMYAEGKRVGTVSQIWADIDDIAPVMARSAVAAEDANYCLHWGLDLTAIRAALNDGSARGGSTISQQVVKNVYLWQGRSWLRKSLEGVMTPVVELVWSKRRILEVYLNVAEFDEGVFGVQAAARHYFGVDARDLTAVQSARLAAILPNPKGRSASNPSSFVRGRAQSIIAGAATIQADGRAACLGG